MVYKEAYQHRVQQTNQHTPASTMRFSFPIATVAFALATSAAPTAEVTTDLPARFGLTTATAEPRANGLRLRVSANGSTSSPPRSHT